MADISLTEITDGSVINSQWEGTGVFDTLIEAVNKNIEIQYNLGRIKSTDYANVYLQGLQTTLQQSVEFLLRQRELEVRLDIMAEEATIARANASLNTAKALAEIKKQYGYDVTLNPDGTLTIGADLQNGLLDKELELKTEQILTEKEQTKIAAVNAKMPLLTSLLGAQVDMFTKKQLDKTTELVTKQSTIETLFNSVSNAAGLSATIPVSEV